jgi:hypothetical protein
VAVDRREEDVLRWAVHEPAIVADWLESSLFRDPTARAAFECLADAATFEAALDSSTGSVRELLERLAVEEPDAGEEDDRVAIGARVMAYTVEPAADALSSRLREAGDERVVELSAALDRLSHAREVGDWPAARDAARELLGWISQDGREQQSAPQESAETAPPAAPVTAREIAQETVG